MADYKTTFDHVFRAPQTEVDIFNVDINSLGCWKTLISMGFEPDELLVLFRQQYCIEIWKQLKGELIKIQFVADLLFKASVKGYLEEILIKLQNTFSLPCSGVVCHQTLYILNDCMSSILKEWLCWSVVYLDTGNDSATATIPIPSYLFNHSTLTIRH
ncbi:hypothetical protein CWB96_21365 [Pseudoalteromonas citrea]|uniref:Uncharacterized protein n=1 Tax=Pseudoalteromonas citrea TaxID=43655 RepID=A0A5S3XHW8_9GAMM|nr:hypothetical protein [Pseudoalteromonas citrea]TMP41768.1 hypothetical protein CWB97_13450 [Pseudoalteromonas citrea]TMP53284.1 hypothetical protein CWB96_21365 [Pseudoalteromonas citrea]